MNKILDTLETIKEIDHKILSELEAEIPSLDNIDKLYDERSTKVNLLNQEKGQEKKLIINDLTSEELEELKNLILVIGLLEQKINKRLTVMLQGKAKALEKISMVKKAKNSYDNVTANGQKQSVLIEAKS